MELRTDAPGLLSRLAAAVALFLAVAVWLAPAPAGAAATPELKAPDSFTQPPRGYRMTAKQVQRVAARDQKIRDERSGHRDFDPSVYTRGPGRWQVSWFDRGDEVAQVRVDDATGAVLESWTGDQVAWTMARGYEGAFGRKVNAPWIWIPLCVLFLVPFVDPRRPLRLLHLDLLVLLAFGASHVFFNRGEIGVSVPLVYPVLLYLLVRLVMAGMRPRRDARPADPGGPGGLGRGGAGPAGGLPGGPERDRLERDRRGLRGRDRGRPDRGRRRVVRAEVQRGRRTRRHLRAGELPALRALRAGHAVAAARGTTSRRRTPPRWPSTS